MKKKLQEVLNSEIPLSKHIGIQVGEISCTSVSLHAPLENNINHKCTAFGGSIYSVAVLAGWSLIYLLLENKLLSGHIVIQESNIKYIKPVTSEIKATCSFESVEQQEKFIGMFKRKGISRITLEATITCNSEVAGLFKGVYVVHTR